MNPFCIIISHFQKKDYKAIIIFDDLGIYYYMPEANHLYYKEQIRLQTVNDDYIEIIFDENEHKGTSFMRLHDDTTQININFFSNVNFSALKKFLNIYLT